MKLSRILFTTMFSCVLAVVSVHTGISSSAGQNGQNPNLQSGFDGSTEYIYKRASGADLKLYVFKPKDLLESDKRPAVIFFGGGAWTTLGTGTVSRRARELASKGMIAVVATYRVRSVNNSTPYESVADAKSAVRWFREHASEMNIQPDRIVAGGGSAGAHIALTAALLTDFDEPNENQAVSSKPNALVLWSPVPNLVPDPGIELTQVQKDLLAFVGARAKEISPIHHLGRNLPPTIIFHGKKDDLVPFSEVEQFCNQGNILGNSCELVPFEDSGHNDLPYQETEILIERFLKDLGYLH